MNTPTRFPWFNRAEWFFIAWCALCVGTIALSGCATLGVDAPKTFNEKAVVAYSTLTVIRDTTIALLREDKISAVDAENIEKQADNVRTGLDLARQIHISDPGNGENRLNAAITILKALEDYLRGRQ